MMNKVVPLALLLGSSLAVDNFITSSNWAAGNTATASADTTNAAHCCFFTGAVGVAADNTISGTASGTQVATTGPCYGFAGSGTAANTLFTAATTLAIPLDTPNPIAAATGPAATDAAASLTYAKNAQQASASTSADGTTLTLQIASGDNGANAEVCKQTMTRTVTAPSSDFVGSWSIGAANGDATSCCFLQTSTNLAIAVSGSYTKASGPSTADTTPCATSIVGRNAAYTVVLEAGATGVAQTILSGTASDDTFTLSTDKNTITWRPKGSATCSQTLTKVSSSGVHLANIMTPIVVGGAMLGLVVV